jgi:hypothetical protein
MQQSEDSILVDLPSKCYADSYGLREWGGFENVVFEGLLFMCLSACCFECAEAKYIWTQTFNLALLLFSKYKPIKRPVFVSVLNFKYVNFNTSHVLSDTNF